MQVERMTYKQGAKHNHNNGLTYRKQHANTQAATVYKSKERDNELYWLDKWTTPLVEV
jgi:hypothetical protein